MELGEQSYFQLNVQRPVLYDPDEGNKRDLSSSLGSNSVIASRREDEPIHHDARAYGLRDALEFRLVRRSPFDRRHGSSESHGQPIAYFVRHGIRLDF